MRLLSYIIMFWAMIYAVGCNITSEDRCVKLTTELTYQPGFLPLQVGFDPVRSELSVKARGELMTPLGQFGLEGGLATDTDQIRLIVIAKDQQHVYRLDDHTSETTFAVTVETDSAAQTTIAVHGCKTIVVEVKTEGNVRVFPSTPDNRPPTEAPRRLQPTPLPPTATPRGFVCADTLPTRLRVGARGYVSTDPVNILCRVPGPCLPSDRLNAIGRGARFTVVDGPVCRGGYIWWRVDPDDPRKPTAWTAEANSYEYWVSPIN